MEIACKKQGALLKPKSSSRISEILIEKSSLRFRCDFRSRRLLQLLYAFDGLFYAKFMQKYTINKLLKYQVVKK